MILNWFNTKIKKKAVIESFYDPLKENFILLQKLKYKEIQQGFSYFKTFLRYFAV